MLQIKKQNIVNPNHFEPKPIIRSVNEDQGMEFTWSTWFWINDLDNADKNNYKKIFSNYSTVNDNDDFLMNSPGLYLAPNTNELHVVLNTFTKIRTLQEILMKLLK